jgi:hypothetical protein
MPYSGTDEPCRLRCGAARRGPRAGCSQSRARLQPRPEVLQPPACLPRHQLHLHRRLLRCVGAAPGGPTHTRAHVLTAGPRRLVHGGGHDAGDHGKRTHHGGVQCACAAAAGGRAKASRSAGRATDPLYCRRRRRCSTTRAACTRANRLRTRAPSCRDCTSGRRLTTR